MSTIGKTRQPFDHRVRGVLHRLPEGEFVHSRIAPPLDLADRIEYFWRVRWDLEGLPPRVQETLPHPNVHIVIEPRSAAIWGVHTRRWTRELAGRSQAFGIKFRPGAFRSLVGGPLSELADRSLPLAELFGPEAVVLNEVLDCADAEAAALSSDFLRARLPALDAPARLVGRIVDCVAEDLTLHSVDALARRFEMNPRTLQRLFNDRVGVGAKWVIKRYRMHEALARVQAGQPASWAALAQDLGYFDQAHFIADFRRLVGETPASYARAIREV